MSVPGELVITRSLEGDAMVLSLRGELDLASTPLLERELREAESANPVRLIVDLEALGFIDSSGIHALIRASSRARSNRHHLAFRRGSTQVRRVLEITGLLDSLPFED